MEQFRGEFEKATKRHELIVFFCECEITYSGRAEAFLPRGERLIIIKQDGVLLIHQPINGNPINYLKSGSELSIEMVDDGETSFILLKGRYTPNKEFIEIKVFEIFDTMRRSMEDGQRQTLFGSEAEMSDAIRENPILISKDFKPVSREEHTKVGFIDLFGHDGKGNLVIVECKRYTAGLSAVSQLRRYVEKMKKVRGTENVIGVMASPKISTHALEMLNSYGYSWKLVEPPKRHVRYNKRQRSLNEFQKESQSKQ